MTKTRKKYDETYYKKNKTRLLKQQHDYYMKHKKTLQKYSNNYYLENKNDYKQYFEKYYDEHKKEILEYNRKYKRLLCTKNPNLYKSNLLRVRINQLINCYTERGWIFKTSKDGIDYLAIIGHLGKHPGKNYILNFIIPLHKFDLSDKKQIIKAVCPENLRWIKKKTRRVI